MKCPNCDEELNIDDVDYRFKGNKDVYAYCEHCLNSFILYYRYGKLWKYTIHDLINDEEYGLVENPKTETKTIIVYKGDIRKENNNG